MIKLIQDLNVIGPLLFIAVLFLSAGFAVWLIIQLRLKDNGHRTIHNNIWDLKRNASRLKGMHLQ